MKKTYSTLSAIGCCLLSLTGMAQNAIPNGNFETWKTAYYNTPEYYIGSSNTQTYYQTNDSLFNCLRTTDAHHGSYAIKVITIADPAAQDTSTGYFLNIDPTNGNSPNTWHGGVPCTQKPTGITGWYKSAVPSNDTAFILVAFSKAGSNIGFFPFKLYGTHSTYTRFAFTFSLSATPDSVIFGAVSSDFMKGGGNGKFQGIPGSMLEIDSVSLLGVASQPAELNGDFENWQNDTIVNPFDWYVQNNGGKNGVTGVTQTTDSKEGKYAVELTTYLGNSNNHAAAQSGQISTGYYPNNCNSNCNEEGGYAYAKQNDTLAFWYKYAPSGNDSAMVQLNFIKNGKNIWGTGQYLLGATTYTYVEVPFNVGQTPDSAIVTFQSSSYTDSAVSFVGSILKVDGAHFKSQPLPVTPIITSGVIGNSSVVLTSSDATGNQWYLNGVPISGATGKTYTATANGSYTVKSTLLGVVSAMSAPASITTGIEDYSINANISVFPNPSNGNFSVVSQTEILSIEVLNTLGASILSQQINSDRAAIDLSLEPNGIYFIRISSTSGITIMKIILNK